MKLLVVSSRSPRISETFVADHVNAMVERGIETDFAYLKPDKADDLVDEGPQLVSSVSLESFYTAGGTPDPVSISSVRSVGGLAQSFAKVLFRHPSFVSSMVKEGRYSLLRLMPDSNRARKFGTYDVIHCHYGTTARYVLAALFAGKIRTRALVVSFHGYDMRAFDGEDARAYSSVFRFASKIIANSQFTHDALVDLGCDSEKISVVTPGVDIEKWKYRQRRWPTDNKVRVLSVGRLVQVKGHRYALEAIAQLADEFDVEYTIVGDGPLHAELKAEVGRLGLQERVKLQGALDSESVKEFMQRSDVFLHPSIRDDLGREEGLGIVIREAAASGMLLAGSISGGIPESIGGNGPGVLVEPKNPEAIADAIRILISQKGEWESITKSVRLWAESHFSSDKKYDRLVEIYAEALDNNG